MKKASTSTAWMQVEAISSVNIGRTNEVSPASLIAYLECAHIVAGVHDVRQLPDNHISI
jgi:hypothetical protein